MLSRKFKLFFPPTALFFIFIFIFSVEASTLNELKNQLSDKGREIEQLEKEIASYQKELENNSKQASTLKSKIKDLEITGKKLTADIKLTQKQIDSARLNIQKLDIQIKDKNENIAGKKGYLKEFVSVMNISENLSAVEMSLSEGDWSEFFADIERNNDFQEELNSNLEDLRTAKTDLEEKKKEKEKYKKSMENMKIKYSDQKQLVDINKKSNDELLKETQNKEATYKKLLAEKLAKKEAFEKEIDDLEEKIRLEIDPNSIPRPGKVLFWPLDKVFITQKFGYTSDSKRLYKTGTHNGVDFRASVGTPVKSALSGVVVGTGNTDAIKGCYSFGKWILIKHYNGLSTIYAHLSLVKVAEGATVNTGDIIGYSGNTGYSTGPHLHLTVYATQGVQIKKFDDSVNCKNARIPIAAKNAYLDPLDYLR